MKKIIIATLILVSITSLFGASIPKKEDNFKIINGILKEKTDDGIIIRCIKIKYEPPCKRSKNDSASERKKGKHAKTDKHGKNAKNKLKNKGKKDKDKQLKAAIKAYKKQYKELLKGRAQGRIMLINYPNVSSLAIGDTVKIGAYEIGVIKEYTIDGKLIKKSLKLYSVSPEEKDK